MVETADNVRGTAAVGVDTPGAKWRDELTGTNLLVSHNSSGL